MVGKLFKKMGWKPHVTCNCIFTFKMHKIILIITSQDTITGASLGKVYTKVTSFKYIRDRVSHDKNQATKYNICIKNIPSSLLKIQVQNPEN